MLIDDLRDADVFSELTEDELDNDVKGEVIELKPDEALFYEGDEAANFYIVIEGILEVFRVIKGQKLTINHFSKGMSGGEVPLLSGTPHLANGVAITDMKIFKMDAKDFWYMLGNCDVIRSKVLSNMKERMLDLQRLSFQREKLVSLGTMSAGLAHELNNPASAAKRTADDLADTLSRFNFQSSEMLKWVMLKDEVDKSDFPFQPLVDIMKFDGFELDPIEKSDIEDELADWLESVGVGDPFEAASTLVSVGFTKENLSNFMEKVVPEHLVNSLEWLAKDVEMRILSNELKHSTARISDLISAMKSYSYMDKNVEKKKIDVHEGIENTLTILNHKLKKKQINVKKDFDNDIPKISAYGGELNQVWTNLLDNAIFALGDEGNIGIKTYPNNNGSNTITVEISDDGKGIPKDIQNKIFDPFFTTKEPGEGTGMGLEISHRIIVNQHKGSIDLESKPGNTKFIICLPVDD